MMITNEAKAFYHSLKKREINMSCATVTNFMSAYSALHWVFPSFFIFIYILYHCLLFKCSLPLVSLSWCDVESTKLVNSHWGQFHPASGKWQQRSSRRIMWQSSFHALWLQHMWGLNNCREIRGPSHLRSPLFIHTTHECVCFYLTSHQVGEDPCIMVSALK